MANLDDTHQALISFSRALIEFNENLALSIREVKSRHADIDGLWNDTVSQRYQAVFGPFAESMDLYVAANAPKLEDFLKSKIAELDQYLHGS
jgi:hypothetical protein